MSTQQKFALITGATSGIGYELAKLFAKDKYNLVIIARTQSELEAKAKEFKQEGIEVIPIAKDLFNREEAFALCKEVESRNLQIDVLVNDAGQGYYGLFNDTDIERDLNLIDLDVVAPVILTKHFLKGMIQRGEGKILNLASITSKTPGPWQSIYHANKAFILSFSEAIRAELRDTNITVTALMPGITDTDFYNKADMNSSSAVQDKEAMDDPADVARDGYEALMAGKDKVISGFKTKVQVLKANLKPDSAVAEDVYDMLKPAGEGK